jgi:membrane protein
MPLPGGGRVGFGHLVKRIYEKFTDHAVTSTAATLSFYFIFSLFPFLIVVVMLTEYLPLFGPSVQRILAAGSAVLPREAMGVIQAHLDGHRTPPKLLTLGVVVTLYSASRGVDAVRTALNLSYDVKESRPLWRTQGLAVSAVVGGALMVLLAVTVAVAGGDLGYWLARQLGIAGIYVDAWRWARWPVAALLTMFMAALGYYALPDVKQEFKFITPGSLLCTVAALVATWGFGVYASHFGSYDVAYGSLGGAVILMTWFYILGVIYLVGGEINATIEHESPVGKQEGARAAGQAPPPPAERPSAAPVGAAGSAEAAERSPGGAAPLRPSRTPST